MNIRIAVISLWAEDMATAVHFYRDVIGLNLMPRHGGDKYYFDLDGIALAIISGRPAIQPDLEMRFPVVAFSVPDLGATIGKLSQHGVDMPWGVEKNDDCQWVMFHDPAGNLVELVEFRK